MNFLNNRIFNNYLVIVLLIAIFSSCSIQNKTRQPIPAWTVSRPKSDSYYIGIARLDKKSYPVDYQATAKKKALTDLSSEISIHIESNSLLSSYENNNHFNSDYQQYIKAETEKDLSGFELVGSYENKNIYQVYYRLSKSKWAEIQAERKSIAIEKAHNLYMQALQLKKELNYLATIKYELNALLELKKYWNESLTYKKGESQGHIDIEIKNDLLDILSNIKLVSNKPRIILNSKNHFKGNIALSVLNKKGDFLKGFPIEISYKKKDFPYQKSVFSEKRPLDISVSDVDFTKQQQEVQLRLIKEKILNINSEDRRLLRFVDEAFNKNPLMLPIDIEYPPIYIGLSSKIKPLSEFVYYLQNGIKSVLIENHFLVVDSLSKADLKLIISTNEIKGDSLQKYKQVGLSYSVDIKPVSDDRIMFAKRFPKIKAVDRTIKKAEEKAYKKAAEEFQEEYATVLINGLFK